MILLNIGKENWKAVSRLSAKWPQEARETLETTLLPKWAEAVARGEIDKADRRLKAIRSISVVLGTRNRDLLFRRMVAEMITLDPKGAQSMVRPLCKFRKALDIIDEGMAVDAGRDLFLAEQELRSAQSAAAILVQFQRALWQYNHAEVSSALDILTQLGQDSRLAEYPSLEARRQALLGDILRQKAAPTEANAAYKKAANLFWVLGEQQNSALVEMRLASVLDTSGFPDLGWKCRVEALAWAGAAWWETQRQT